MKNRDIVSIIRSVNKLFSDATLNDRVILAECRDVANMIVKQTLDKRKLLNSPNLFAYIQCLEMEEVSLSECCTISSPASVAKSKKKLPKVGEGIFGLAIQGIFGIDGKIKFKESNPNRYANTIKLKLKTKDVFYWIVNDYLYVSNYDTKAVNGYFYFTEDIPNDILFPGEDCDCKPKPTLEQRCLNSLDKPFFFLADRINDLKNIVEQRLLQSYFNIPLDKTSNQLDEQSK